MEEWRDIKGYEGLYQVSNLGRVKSLNYNRTGREKVLKYIKNATGYLTVGLTKDGQQKKYLVHRLVAIHFIPNPLNKKTVNHINEDKTNNCIDNLEWLTLEENNRYGTHDIRSAKTRGKSVIGFNITSGYIIEFYSTREAERVLKIRHVSECCRNVEYYKTAGGFMWYYKE